MLIKATKTPKHINVIGQKDPRGWDNTITIFIDEKGDLRIKVQKPLVRCYEFSHIEENGESITVVQKR